ncbi:MAG: methyltransferase domain-containing protein [Chitinivibrionales bacterium]|nr:methyltransferase domain-containing protein [Chitinivibrionales bacterium]
MQQKEKSDNISTEKIFSMKKSDDTPSRISPAQHGLIQALYLLASVAFKWFFLWIRGGNKKQRTTLFWDMISERYDLDSSPDRPEHKAVQNARKYLKSSDSVLDFGCATAGVMLRLADSVGFIHGIDISPKMIEAGRDKLADRGIANVETSTATILDEYFKPETFDVILALNIVHLLDDRKRALARAYELLRPGGYLITVTPCLAEARSFKDRMIYVLLLILTGIRFLPHIGLLRSVEVANALVNAGFEIVETKNLERSEQHFVVGKKVLLS